MFSLSARIVHLKCIIHSFRELDQRANRSFESVHFNEPLGLQSGLDTHKHKHWQEGQM